MKLVHTSEVDASEVTEQGASDVTVRWLLSRPEGAPNFAMRLFELAPGGRTPLHEHAWEHEVYILEGQAEVITKSGSVAASSGDAVLVLPNETHQFRNAGAGVVKFLCMIPLPG
jgi:quercetin dioxygenase-like cupin family protein